jgi:hypothetical protein
LLFSFFYLMLSFWIFNHQNILDDWSVREIFKWLFYLKMKAKWFFF